VLCSRYAAQFSPRRPYSHPTFRKASTIISVNTRAARFVVLPPAYTARHSVVV